MIINLLSSVNSKMQQIISFVVDWKVNVSFLKATQIYEEHNVSVVYCFENLELQRR